MLNKIRSFINSKTALLLYKTTILSYFDVGDIFYDAANKDPLNRLQLLQNKALCCIFAHDSEITTLERYLYQFNLLMLQDKRNVKLVAFAHKKRLGCFKLVPKKDRSVRSNDEKLMLNILAKKAKYERSFVCISIKLGNEASKALRDISEIENNLFKIRYKTAMWNNFINFSM